MVEMLNRIRNRGLRALVGNGDHQPRPHGLGSGIRSVRRRHYVWTAAELAPCTCPDSCERDHGND